MTCGPSKRWAWAKGLSKPRPRSPAHDKPQEVHVEREVVADDAEATKQATDQRPLSYKSKRAAILVWSFVAPVSD